MIPAVNNVFLQQLEYAKQPTYTYFMDLSREDRIRGYTDGLEAMRQAIYKILLTERFDYQIYSWNYGIELKDLFGMPVDYCIAELERRIYEALVQDDRISDVDEFEFDTSQKGVIGVTFTAHTEYGDIEASREVDI